jgi:hypothetical protein
MHTLTFIESGEVWEYPSAADEFTTKQWLGFIELLLLNQSNAITTDDFKTRMALLLLNIDYPLLNHLKKRPKALENIYINLARVAETVDSFFEVIEIEGKNSLVPIIKSTTNLLPVIKTPWFKKNLHGPNDALYNITYHEYIEAHTHYVAFVKNHDDNDLNMLVATLYRPKKQKFNEELVVKQAKQIAKLPYHIRYSVYLFFRSCENFFQTGTIDINGVEVDLKVLYEPDPDAPNIKGIGMLGVLFELAQSGVFGNVDQTANRNLYEVLARLYQMRQTDKGLKEYYRSKNQTNP